MPEPVDVTDRLDADEPQQVLDLVARAREADGVAPLSEQAVLAVRRSGAPGHHLLLRASGGDVVGYAHLTPAAPGADASAELVVDPGHRRRGHGRRLVEALLGQVDGPLRLWAHGDGPDARSLAATTGFRRVRELWQMRRGLAAPLPPLEVPDGVRLRTFTPGDADDLVRVNAEAFVDHPEQGRWTRADVDARLGEPWFDPDGLFLAEDAADPGAGLLGFHWTKVLREVGEVYVVGVSPRAQGRGLGRVLTLAGLHHLRGRGLPEVLLYVDADNVAAVRTYTALGFTRAAVDVQLRRPG